MSTRSRRAFAHAAGGALAFVATAASGKGKPKKPTFRTVTRTFTNASPIDLREIGAAVPYPSAIKVSGLKDGKVLDVNVTLKRFNHEFPRDVDVLLVAPNGRHAVIMSDAGGGEDVTNVTVILDDQAAAKLPEFSRLGSGRFKPTNFLASDADVFPAPAPPGSTANVKLSTFAGVNPNGLWRLFIADDFDSLSGTLEGGWSLTITARVRT